MPSQNKRPRRGHGEGAIYWRESRKRWIAELKLENGKSKYFSGKSYAEAKQKLNQAQLEQRQGKLATGPKQTVKDFLNYWFEEVHSGALKTDHLRHPEYCAQRRCSLATAHGQCVQLGHSPSCSPIRSTLIKYRGSPKASGSC